MRVHQHVKEMPRRVRRRSVIASLYLGWSSGNTLFDGYRCLVVTQDTSTDDPMIVAYLMRAASLDEEWYAEREWFNIAEWEASALIQGYLRRDETEH